MNVFLPEVVFAVEPDDRTLWPRYDFEITPVDDTAITHPIERPFWCTGIRRHDLAIFGAALDHSGVTKLDLLVNGYVGDTSLVISSELIEEDPLQIRPDLAQKIKTLSFEEVAQLGLSKHVFDTIDRRYPNIRPLTK